MPYRGPLKPNRNTQAMPVLPKGKRAPTLVRFRFELLSGFGRNAKKKFSAKSYSLVKYHTPKLLIRYGLIIV
jgi:hypothetical protein